VEQKGGKGTGGEHDGAFLGQRRQDDEGRSHQRCPRTQCGHQDRRTRHTADEGE